MRSRFLSTVLIAGAVLAFASCSGHGTMPAQGPAQNTQGAAASTTSANSGMPAPPYHLIEAPVSRSSTLQSAVRAAASTGVTTIPVWSNSFSVDGTAFPYTMIGTSPFERAASTVIPTEIQPLAFVYANGTRIDGSAAAAALAASPVFHSTVFPTEAGQFVDVMQRANFESVIGTGYHVRLGTPVVLPQITIAVPSAVGKVGVFSNHTIGLLDFDFLFNVLQNVIATQNYNPATFPIFIVGNVFEYSPRAKTPRNCCIGGFHFAQLQGANGVLTFAYAAYNSPGIFVGDVEDITIPSHEVAEWANDPLIGNLVPPWGDPGNPSVCVNNFLEVGDPLERFVPASYPVTLNGTTYHPQDIAFFSWFAHQVPSIAVNGQYSYLTPEKLTAPPPPCQ